MKNKKTLGILNTLKKNKKAVKNTGKYTEEYDDAYYEDEEYDGEEDYYEEEYYDEEAYEEEYDEDAYDEEEYDEQEYIEEAYEEEALYDDGTYAEEDSEYEEEYAEYEEEAYEEETAQYAADAYEKDAYYEEDYTYADSYYEDEAGIEYYEADDGLYEEEEEDYYPVDDGYFGESLPERVLGRIKHWLQHMTAFDAVVASMGGLLLVVALVTFNMWFESQQVEKQIQAIVPLGMQLSSVGVVGESGLLAMSDAAAAGQLDTEIEAEEVQSTESEDETVTKVNVNFTSVEKDLKIKFTDAALGTLITGTSFEVLLTNAKGNTTTLTDSDQDGIIHETNMTAGKYDVVIRSTDKYKFPETAHQVTVKDKIEYVVINVQDEIKTENQVNAAVEDTAKVDAKQEEVTLTDTVEWVESAKTLVSGSEGYTQVDKSTIPDPSVTSRAGSGLRLLDTMNITLNKTSMSLYAGSSDTLTGTSFSDSVDGDKEYKYTTEWKSSNEEIATVSGGTVTARAAGKATITYTVTKETITKKYTEPVTVTISVEEYEALSDEEKAKYTEEKDADGNITGYSHTTEAKEDGTTSEKESASATCEVTVQAVTVASASLELTKTADSCNVRETLTVKPGKLVYTKNDGSTETITENFPAVTWSSSDTAVATVDANGVVTGVKAGKATITGQVKGIKDAEGKELTIKAATDITVNALAALSLTLDRTQAYIEVGKTTTIVPAVSNYQSDKGVTWTTADKKIATVNENGVVTGVAAGSVKITATTKEKDAASGNAVTATCVVTVNSNATSDKTTKLKDKNGNQVYVKDSNGNYIEAVYADYFTASAFYLRTQGQYTYVGWQTINGKTYYYDKNCKPVTGTQIIQGVQYHFGSDGALQTNVNGTTLGIDVSKWNGSINWPAVKSSGVDYVIIRCGYRGSSTGALIQDPTFKTNIKGATAAGLKVGLYFFTQAVNEVEAVEEASMAISLAKGYGLTYPIFIDTESSGGRGDAIDTATRTAVVNAFCRTVQSAGYQAGIYASKSWFEKKLNMSGLNSYKIWLAQYAAAPTYAGRYDLWQYSSKGTINGISGKVDLNISYLGY